MNLKAARAAVSISALAALAPTALAQSNVSPADKFSWSENCGWMNWRDAGNPAASQGAIIAGTFLSGFVWCENIGWMNLGDGSPANSVSYANTTGADSGVNLDPSTGALTGLAWGENVGWINFAGGAMATPPNAARLDTAAGRLRGFAWGENIGWINLDDDVHFVAVNPLCPCDWNHADGLDSQDYFDFLDGFFNGDADFNGIDGTDSQDYFDFLNCFFTGCP